MLKAGYLEDWRWHATLSGAPQGGVASPVLSNIYLDRLDQFVEQSAAARVQPRPPPAAQPGISESSSTRSRRARRHGDREAVRSAAACSAARCRARTRTIRATGGCVTSGTADDWLLGFAGPKHEAEQIKSRIAAFLREELKLELSQSKTLITHATSQAARFLGYEIRAQHADTKITRGPPGGQRRRSGCSCPRPSSGSGARST